jgi:hypothetical protein
MRHETFFPVNEFACFSRPDFFFFPVGETQPRIVSGKNTGDGCGIENSNGQPAEKNQQSV